MSDARQIEADIYERLSKVIDPELGRSVTDLGMIAAIEAAPASSDAGTYDVTVHVELTVPGCPLSETITSQINGAVSSYPGAQLLPHIEVGSMSRDKLADLVADLKAERKQNPFSKPGVKTRIFAIASGKGGVGKSSVTANLAATFAALGFDQLRHLLTADLAGLRTSRAERAACRHIIKAWHHALDNAQLFGVVIIQLRNALHQSVRIRMHRLVKDLVAACVLNDLACVHNHNIIRNLCDDTQVVGNHHNGGSGLFF